MAIVPKEAVQGVLTLTDAVQTFTNNGYASGYDSVISETFPMSKLCGKKLTVYSQIVAVIDGSSAHHVTPVIQISNDGTTWFDYLVDEASSSSAVAAGTKWAWLLDLSKVSGVYLRINYVVHVQTTHAAVANESTGSIQTQIAVSAAA